jgi:CHAT domain-containing protein
MFASWRKAPNTTATVRELGGVGYPFSGVPPGPEWELVRIAHHRVVEKRYGRAWTSLDLDLLERRVVGQYTQALNEAEKSYGNGSDAAWNAALKLYDVYDAHDQPAEALSSLAQYLVTAGSSLAADNRITIFGLLARASSRTGNLDDARRYIERARGEITEASPTPVRRLPREVSLAASIAKGRNLVLERESYELALATSLAAGDGDDLLTTKFDILQNLVRLSLLQGDLRSVELLTAQATSIAKRLDANPARSGGQRMFGERLQLARARALADIPSRRNAVMDELLPLVGKLDTIAPVWSRPADDVLEALRETRDPGRATDLEHVMQRRSAGELQEQAFPVLAKWHLANGQWPEAEKTLVQALWSDLRRQSVCGSEEQLAYWRDLSFVAEMQAELSAAEQWIDEWLNCASAASRVSRQTGEALLTRSKLLRLQGDLYGAEYVMRRSLAVISANARVGDLTQADAELALGELLLSEGRGTEAARHLTRATRTLVDGAVDPPAWRGLAAKALSLTSQLQTGQAENAALTFEMVQHGSATQAAAALHAFSQRASLRDPQLAALVQRRIELERRRELLDIRFERDFGTSSAARNFAERDQVVSDLAKIEVEMGRAAVAGTLVSTYTDLVRGRVVTLDELSGASTPLRGNEALVLVTQTPDEAFAYIVRPGRLRYMRLELPHTKTTQLVQDIRRSLTIQPDGTLQPFALGASRALYDALWAPIASELNGIRHVLVVIDGPLGSLPLEVLASGDAAAGSSPRWLDDEDLVLTYLPSVSALSALRKDLPATRASRPVAVFGPPDLSGVIAGTSVNGTANARPALPPCDGTLPQLRPDMVLLARDLANGLGGRSSDSYLAGAFTESRFRRQSMSNGLADYKVIAFVTHGLLAGDWHGPTDTEPALVLTPPVGCRPPSPQDDGLLTASEVSELSLDAEWVLLLACNTAGPDGTLGAEPLSGLARAFLFAGGRALLVSHWAVAATATSEFVTRVFADDTQATSRAERVHRARRQMRTMRENGTLKYAHPALWAAFVVVGDGR